MRKNMSQGAPNGKRIDYRKVTLTQNQGILGFAADRRAGKWGLPKTVPCFGLEPLDSAEFVQISLFWTGNDF